MKRNMILGLILCVAAFGFVACDWLESDSPTDPKSPDLPTEKVACQVLEVGSIVPATGQLCSLSTKADSFVNWPTDSYGVTPVKTMDFPRGYFDQSEADRFVDVSVVSPPKCGLDGQPKCYRSASGAALVRWYQQGSEGRILLATMYVERIPGGIGQAGR